MAVVNEKFMKESSSFVENYVRKKEKIKELVISEEYIKWLEEFTKKYPNFNDQKWLYSPEEISKEDNEMVNILCEFFGYIENFADNHYIYPNECDYGEYYSIEYNNKIYEIGIIVGQGAINFCHTEDVDEDAKVILYNELINPTYTKTNKEAVEYNLDELEKFLKTLNTKNIPLKAIEQKTRIVLSELKKEKNKK